MIIHRHLSVCLKSPISYGFLVPILTLLLICMNPLLSVGADLFVSTTGSGSTCSQANPCTLETAITNAASGDAIYIGQGTFTASGASPAVVSITIGLSMHGGWDGSPTGSVTCDPTLYPTLFDGGGAKRGVHIQYAGTVSLNGFRIYNGKVVDEHGAGLYSQNADLILNRMTFDNNVVESDSVSILHGGGAYIEGGSLLVNNCTFRENSAWAPSTNSGGGLAVFNVTGALVENSLFEKNDAWQGGGLYFYNNNEGLPPLGLRKSTFQENGMNFSPGSSRSGYASAIYITKADSIIEENIFNNNSAANDWGAVAIFDSPIVFSRNILSNNLSYRTSGVYVSKSTPMTITNNLIVGNESRYESPAIMLIDCTGQFLHNTVASNSGDYGIYLKSLGISSASTVSLTNNILVDHTTAVYVDTISTATIEGTVWGRDSTANDTNYAGSGTINIGTINLSHDPRFVNAASGNYRLGPGSAARNAGVNAGLPVDLAGGTRPLGSGYDIGAYENNSVAITPVFSLLLDE